MTLEDVLLRAERLLEDALESEKQCAAFYEREAVQEKKRVQKARLPPEEATPQEEQQQSPESGDGQA
ncbi:hypothetical protein ACFFLM_26385 [Deinococcus oregonensis]|uniref:Uncharacterized protein n=1 Tax=Deinococcus oregonensis TaxID=1805970 RepID=A0ABV6B6S8_9DEIO